MTDLVNHPPHYGADRYGFECIELTRWMPFCAGNAAKYVFRAGAKGDVVQDLEKALVYARWAVENGEASFLGARTAGRASGSTSSTWPTARRTTGAQPSSATSSSRNGPPWRN